jgi:hypothetical protein
MDGELLHEKKQAYSIFPFTKTRLTVNMCWWTVNDGACILILGQRPTQTSQRQLEMTDKLLLKNPNMWLHDIYESFQKYYKEFHEIEITNQSRYVGEVLIFTALANKIFNERYYVHVIGPTALGKSHTTERFLPLITVNYTIVPGTTLTRNAFLGGRSPDKTISGENIFRGGMVTDKDVVVIEESTNALTDFYNEHKDRSNNPYSLIKLTDKPIDVGIQGSQNVNPTAALFMIGNSENLAYVYRYIQAVINKYTLLTNAKNDYHTKWPIFAPVESYIKEMDNADLAKAHYIIRTNSKLVEGGKHFITQLPPAEQWRFTFFIYLEERERTVRKFTMPPDNTKDMTRDLHSEEWILAFAKTFDARHFTDEEKVMYSDKERRKLKQKVFKFIQDDYLLRRNNYIKEQSSTDWNNRAFNNLVNMSSLFVAMQCMYYRQPLEFTEENKLLLENWLLYNYNSLNMDEASMSTKPTFNDYAPMNADNVLHTEINAKQRYQEQLKAKKESEKLAGMEFDNIMKGVGLDDNFDLDGGKK